MGFLCNLSLYSDSLLMAEKQLMYLQGLLSTIGRLQLATHLEQQSCSIELMCAEAGLFTVLTHCPVSG